MATKLVKLSIYRPSRNFLEISILQFDKFFCHKWMLFKNNKSFLSKAFIAFQFDLKTLSWKLKKPINIIILLFIDLEF